ncbi:hypothetical protein Tco_0783000 [Tanacetum coccineum]
MIGTLMYLTSSKPDLVYAVCMCARYHARPAEKHLHVVKRIFRYLRGTVNRGLWYSKDSAIALTAFANDNHVGCQRSTVEVISRSMTNVGDRILFFFRGAVIKRQKSAAISSMEAEYIALSGCCAQVLWMRSQLTGYGLGFNKILMYLENGVIELYFVKTEYQLADIFTKVLCRERFEFFIDKLGMRRFTPEILKELADEAEEEYMCKYKFLGQKFEDLPLEQDILSFIRDLGHTRDITYLTDVNVDYLHQPWRAFATVINKCLSGKETGMDKIHFLFQIENKDAKKTNKMSYPRFTKIIIDYFMSKDQSISRRNKMFWHTARDDTMFTSMRCISRHEDTQVYGTILPKELTNQAMLESKAYQTYYAFASGEKAPKPKYIRKKADSDTSPKKKPVQATKGTRLKTSAKVAKSDKKKQPTKMPKAKGLNVLFEVALTETEQIKLATKRSKTQFHSSHASGLGDGVDTQSRVPDEQQQKVSGTNEGAGVTPEVPDVPKYDSESEEESWTFSQDDKDAEEESDKNDDSEETESDNDEDDLTHPNLSTYKADEEEEEEEKADDEEVSSDQRVSTPPDYELTEEEEYKEDDDKDKEGEQKEEEEDELYIDLNINLERSDAEMTNAQANQDTIDSILYQDTQSDTLVNVPILVAAETLSSVTTIPQPPIPNIQPLQQTPTSTTTTTNPTMTDAVVVGLLQEVLQLPRQST